MNWDDLLSDPPRLDAVAKMYFSLAAVGSSSPVLDLLEKGKGSSQSSALVENLLKVGGGKYRDKWSELGEVDADAFSKVKLAVMHMDATQRLHYFLETDEGRRLFQHYLDRLQILNACNDAGKISPQREAWAPFEGWKAGGSVAQRKDTAGLRERLRAYEARLQSPDVKAYIEMQSESLLRRLGSSRNGQVALIEEFNALAKRSDAPPALRLMAEVMNSGSGVCGVGAESAEKFHNKLQVLAAMMAR